MLNHRRAARPASPETIFSIDYWSIPCSTKKPGAKIPFQLGEQFTQTRRPTMQNGGNSTKQSRKLFSSKFNEKFEKSKFSIFENFFSKIKKFDFSRFSLNFRRKYFSGFFLSNFPHFAWSVAAFE